MRKEALVTVTGILFAIINGCTHKPDYTEFIKQSTYVSNNCNADTVYFENDIMPILTSNCGMAGCHGNGSHENDVNVSSYADILNSRLVIPRRPDKSKIIEVITASGSKVMPPSPRVKVSADAISKIETWIRQGAKNNRCEGCDTTQYKFAANVWPILDASCKSCHSGTFPSGNLRMEGYADAKTNTDNGNLLGTITHTPGYKQMPQGSSKLPDCQISIIRQWIQAGALNN
jgi:hypothetical protein